MSSFHLPDGVVLEMVSAWRASCISDERSRAVDMDWRALLVPSVRPGAVGGGPIAVGGVANRDGRSSLRSMRQC